jgi:hypothetical protein
MGTVLAVGPFHPTPCGSMPQRIFHNYQRLSEIMPSTALCPYLTA